MQIICKNVKGEARKYLTVLQWNTCPCFHGNLGYLNSVSLSHIPTFCPYSRGQARSAKQEAHFPLENIHYFYFAFFWLWCCQWIQELLESLLAPGCVNGLQARVAAGKNAPGVNRVVVSECRESGQHLLLLQVGRTVRCKAEWVRVKCVLSLPQRHWGAIEKWAWTLEAHIP